MFIAAVLTYFVGSIREEAESQDLIFSGNRESPRQSQDFLKLTPHFSLPTAAALNHSGKCEEKIN